MRETLENLYYGNISPNEKTYDIGSEYGRLSNRAGEMIEELSAKLKGDDKTFFEKLIDLKDELHETEIVDSYINGLRLGAKLIIEILCKDKDGPFRSIGDEE